MITYSIELIKKTLGEVCKKFEMTKNITLKDIKYFSPKQYYLVTLADASLHIVSKETVNTYIETFGDKGALEIAGALLHSIELEQTAFLEKAPEYEDYWDGNMQDVLDYLDGKKEKKDITEEADFLDEDDKGDSKRKNKK